MVRLTESCTMLWIQWLQFGITKCYVLILKKEEYSRSELTDQKMKEINIEENYAYFGISEADGVKDGIMKERIKVEYFKRLPKIFKSKLSNTISAINSRSVSNNIIYSAGGNQINKRANRHGKKDKKAIKHSVKHPQASVDRLVEKYREMGLISTEDCVTIELESLRRFDTENDKQLLTAEANEKAWWIWGKNIYLNLEKKRTSKSLH